LFNFRQGDSRIGKRTECGKGAFEKTSKSPSEDLVCTERKESLQGVKGLKE